MWIVLFVLALDRFQAEVTAAMSDARIEWKRFIEKYQVFHELYWVVENALRSPSLWPFHEKCQGFHELCSVVENALRSPSLFPFRYDLVSHCVRRLEHEVDKVKGKVDRFEESSRKIEVCEARLQQVLSSPPSMVMLDDFLDEARQEIVLEMQAVIQTFKQDSTSMDEIVREIEKLNLSLREAINNIGRVVSEGMVAMVAVVAVAVVIYFFVVRLLGLVNGN